MKQNLLFSFLALFFSGSVFSQITLSNLDMPPIGWTQRVAKDTIISGINWGSKGANQTYAFTNLQNMVTDTTMYKALTANQSSNITGANMAITNDDVNVLFSNTSPTKMDFVGIEGDLLGAHSFIQFSPVSKFYQFPTQYQNKFNGTSGFTKQILGSAFNPALPVYEVKVTNTITYTDTIDGWGKVTTPVGSYKCLRQKRVEYSRTIIDYKLIQISPFTNLSDKIDTNIRFYYITKEAKGSVINFTYDSLDNPITATWSLILPAAPVANFGFTYGSGGQVTFADSTDGYPDTYSWTFGDNSASSSSQNPNHTYTANGNYQVCLTVTNAGGSTNYCDSVHITNIGAANLPPVASNDTGSIVKPNTNVTVNVKANDTDPNAGDVICVATVWGGNPALASLLLDCSNIKFTIVNSNFIGKDTFYYKVCDNQNPPLCDTGMVVISVSSTIGIAEISQNSIQIFPNPANDKLFIDLKDNQDLFSESNAAIEIYDLLGKRAAQFAATIAKRQMIAIDISGLPVGTYIITTKNNDKQTTIGRFSKQ